MQHHTIGVRTPQLALRSTVVALALLLCGCAATVRENHFFAAYRTTGASQREPVQFYRVSVDGNSYFSSTRYLTGYFDERAVSLFFNEIKGTAPGGSRPLFCAESVQAETKIAPLAPTSANGAFVLIMSNNVDAVANTIGSFAESQVVADALTLALNRNRVIDQSRSDALLTVDKVRATALVDRLRAQTGAATSAPRGDAAATSYLRALVVLAEGLGRSGKPFDNLTEARGWFDLELSNRGGGN
jgi:hypothetical protein